MSNWLIWRTILCANNIQSHKQHGSSAILTYRHQIKGKYCKHDHKTHTFRREKKNSTPFLFIEGMCFTDWFNEYWKASSGNFQSIHIALNHIALKLCGRRWKVYLVNSSYCIFWKEKKKEIKSWFLKQQQQKTAPDIALISECVILFISACAWLSECASVWVCIFVP